MMMMMIPSIVSIIFLILLITSTQAENPYESGCLLKKNVDGAKLRVCNSEDSSETIEQGKCQQPYLDHLEIRILSQNWETVFFETWLLQIILSEYLQVPTTVETGSPDAALNFYDPNAPFDYGTAGNDVAALVTAAQVKDCTTVKNLDPYLPCAHVGKKYMCVAVQYEACEYSLNVMLYSM